MTKTFLSLVPHGGICLRWLPSKGNQIYKDSSSLCHREAYRTAVNPITIREPAHYRSISEVDSTWLEPNRFIDWQDESILSLAQELDLSGLSRLDAVRRIGEYVLENVGYGSTGDPGR